MTTAIPHDLILHKFPLEILDHILGQVDVPDLAALASSCKALRAVAEPLLHERAAKDPILSKHALLWAADTGNHRILETMLKLGADPNTTYCSFLTKRSLDKVFAAQGGRRGAMGPRKDEHLKAGIDGEVVRRRASARGYRGCPSSLFFLADDRLTTDYDPFTPEIFQPRGLWRWSPIHLAVNGRDEKAVRILLQSGADVNQPCSGICDGLVPESHGTCLTLPFLSNCNFWTALHISVHWRTAPITRLLLLAHSGELATAGAAGTDIDLHWGHGTREWDLFETVLFPGLLRSFGTNWDAIDAYMRMGQNTARRLFVAHKDKAENSDWESIANEADAKAARGEKWQKPPLLPWNEDACSILGIRCFYPPRRAINI